MDFKFWSRQIEAAKTAHKVFFEQAKEADDIYSGVDRNYNILFSNVSVLTANLCLNNPKPDIQRRFLKRMETDKKKTALYAEVAKVLSGAIEFVNDDADVDGVIRDNVEDSVKNGRGVAWVSYEPDIKTDQNGVECVSAHKISVERLRWREYLQSSADKKEDVWWVARRHLLTKQDISARFGYVVTQDELKFTENGKDDETLQKRAEVWEIWDKVSKKRGFILLGASQHKMLEVKEDPYQLSGFFPVVSLNFVVGQNGVPVPEYFIYQKQADLLEVIERKIAQISESVKFVTIIGSQDKNAVSTLFNADNGDVVSLPVNDLAGALQQSIATYPVEAQVALLNYLEEQKERIKTNIFDITGISDIMRGVTDARETASAQMIKGVFGSLRFQDRQRAVQEFRRKIYKIIAEIIAEHYDEQTLADMTCTYLPTADEQKQIILKIKELKAIEEQAKATGQKIEPVPTEELARLAEQPTWPELMAILHSDKLRNYTVGIETTATAFDDLQLQRQSIADLTNAFVNLVAQASTLQSPELVRGFIPIIRMNLSSIKVSSSISRQLEETLEGAYREIKQKMQAPPQPTPETIKAQADLLRANIEKDKVQAETILKQEEMNIKRQEAERKETELQMQYDLKVKEIKAGKMTDPNIIGDVRPL